MDSFPQEILLALTLAMVERCTSIATPLPTVNGGRTNTPPPVTGKKKLEECQKLDQKKEAQFALRTTDLQILKKYFPSRKDSDFTNMDPLIIQHWSLVVHFSQDGGKTLFFEAVEDKRKEGDQKGVLQAYCAENVDDEVFKRAKYFCTFETSPNELLEKAKLVSSNGTMYDGLHNNCQSWVKEFLGLISPHLLNSLIETISPAESTRDLKVTKLEECEEEFDQTKREAQFAFQITEPHKTRSPSAGEEDAGSDSKDIQHWALVVYFPRGKKTYQFEAWKDDNGLLQPGRAEGVNFKAFKNSIYFGTAVTSPSELLKKAKDVPSNGTAYNAALNNDGKSWLQQFLTIISPELLSSLFEKLSSIAVDAE